MAEDDCAGDPSAETYKKKGNDAFKAQDWDEAIKNYNKAIQLDPNQAVFYSNRAARWSSKGKHENALNDSNKCIERDPNYVKGYTRKGKALADLGKLDEAEAAYKEGLGVEAGNDACTQGVTAVERQRQARNRPPPRSGGSSSSSGGFGGLGGIFGNFLGKMKKGGRMQMYLVIFAAYYMYNQYIGKNQRGKGEDAESAQGATVDDASGSQASLTLRRGFVEVGGAWLSQLEAVGAGQASTQLLMLHRTASSAEAEFGSTLGQIASRSPSGVQVLAPDRPCHGFSPCPESGEGNSGWLNGLLKQKRASKNLAIVASGREALSLALSLARARQDPTRLLLLNPFSSAPSKPEAATATALSTWLDGRAASTAREAADAAMWAASAASASDAESEDDSEKLPDGLSVTLLYAKGDEEDGKLKHSLEDQGAEVDVRRLRADSASGDELAAEVRRLLRGAGVEEEEDDPASRTSDD